MATVSIKNLTFSYDRGYENVFEDATFQFDTDWRLGLVGRNGRGKTTLLRLLLGRHDYRGSISAPCGFSYFPFEVSDADRNTLDIVDDCNPDYEFWELCRELGLLGFPEEALFRPFGTLSNGEQTKALIAALFLRRNDFLLLDEPTNHLDAAGREILTGYLQGKKGFLLVSHDRALLDAVTDHTLSIGRASIDVQAGGFTQWYENKERRDRFELAENEKLKKEVARHTAAARRTAGWSDKVEASKTGNGPVDRGYIGHKSAKMMKRAKSAEARREDAAQKAAGLLHDIDRPGALKLTPLKHHAQTLAELSDVAVCYGGAPVLSGFSLKVGQGERVALRGRNGSGKSSVLKLLGGEGVPHAGSVRLASGLVLSRVPQDTASARGSLQGFAQEAGVDRTLLTTILRNFGFERSDFDSDLSALSEGQKKKALLARSLCEQAHLYLWDEPLNYIDVLSRMQIEELILRYSPTLLFVEHDTVFAERIATRSVDL